tara:strand:+ start:268 stop:2625 length:2358 start_codon:yes stop_codon:yes gene_type:complete
MPQKDTIEISVRELVSKFYTGGDLVFSSSLSNAANDGSVIHQLWQKNRKENYQAEVPVDYTFPQYQPEIRIRGRIDGIYPEREIITIEEIKSTIFNPNESAESPPFNHLAQLMVYGYLYGLQQEWSATKSICLNLVYIQAELKDFAFYSQIFAMNKLEQNFNSLINKFLQWNTKLESWRQNRNSSAQSIKFPFETYRDGQRQLAVSTYRVIRDKKRLLVEAPTGIGKTISTLFPGIKAMGENLTQKIFYLTARNTVQTIGEHSLRLMVAKGLKVRSVTIVARDRTCLDMNGACRINQCERCPGYYDRLPAAMQDVMAENILDQSKIKELADKHNLCPFEFSLDASLAADVIFCDYNYAFHPRATLRRHFVDKIENHILFMDEGHHLIERARSMFSADLHTRNLKNLTLKIRTQEPELAKALVTLVQWVERQARLSLRHKNNSSSSSLSAPIELKALISSLCESLQLFLTSSTNPELDRDVREIYFDILWFQHILSGFDEDYLCLLDQNTENTSIKLFCIDPSTRLESSMKRAQSTVLFSATLRPLSYYKELLNWSKQTPEVKLESPFNPSNLNFLIDTSLSLRYQDRSKSLPSVIDRLITFLSNCPGNILIFSPSYEYQRGLVYEIQKRHPKRDYIIQEPEMNYKNRSQFLNKFQSDSKNHETVGFAVLGGLFSEGIDLVGDQLQGVIIIGVGSPPPSQQQKELQEYFEREYQQGFEYGFRLPGFQRVLQAAGRVIRSPKDRGSVMLIDQRYSQSAYKKLFPRHWRPIHINNCKNLEIQLKAFWN